jgi:hypothetical protein
MRLSREVDNRVGLLLGDQRVNKLRVRDVAADKPVIGTVCHRRDVIQIAGVGKFVEIDDAMSGGHQHAYECRSDESCAAGDDKFHWQSQ